MKNSVKTPQPQDATGTYKAKIARLKAKIQKLNEEIANPMELTRGHLDTLADVRYFQGQDAEKSMTIKQQLETIHRQDETIIQQNETITSLTESLKECSRILDNVFATLEDTAHVQDEALQMVLTAKDLLADADTPLKATTERAKHANIMAQFDANFGRYGVEDFGGDKEDTDVEFEGTSFYDKLRESIREQIHQPLPFIPYANGSIVEHLSQRPELLSSAINSILGKPTSSAEKHYPQAEQLHECGCRKTNRPIAVDEDLRTLTDFADSLIHILSPDGYLNQLAQTVVPIINKRPDLVQMITERFLHTIPSIVPAILAATTDIGN